jgi:single-stranded DNA-binding protein
MALSIEGRVMQITPIETGEGPRGPWQKRMLIIETLEQFPRKVAFVAWGDRAQALDSLEYGNRVVVNFTLESRNFNDRWYTDARLFGVKVIKEEEVVSPRSASTPQPGPQQGQQTQTPPQENPLEDIPQDDNLDDYDDLLNDTDDMLDNDITNDDDFFSDEDTDDDLPF